MSNKLYSTSDIARKLGLSRHVISYRIHTWAVRPMAKIGGRNVFSSGTVKALGKMLEEYDRIKKFKVSEHIRNY